MSITQQLDSEKKIIDLFPKRRTFKFVFTSTTDWFRIGIVNAKLILANQPQIDVGYFKHYSVRSDHFEIAQTDLVEMKGHMEAVFEVPAYQLECVLWKSDDGTLEVEVWLTGGKGLAYERPLKVYKYARSPKKDNEVTFQLFF